MNSLNRREALKVVLGGLLQTAGTVVLASAVLPARAAGGATSPPGEESVKDLEQRANQVAEAQAALPEGEGPQLAAFVNGGFVNGGGGGGGFRKGAFANGGFNNGGFRKAGWVNGGWRN
ncbi:MAG TPA: hypothetical protein VKA46_24895 [Gemmataceae bacterium]|nr:hypothetical protein [Gemmataceae bacterium]